MIFHLFITEHCFVFIIIKYYIYMCYLKYIYYSGNMDQNRAINVMLKKIPNNLGSQKLHRHIKHILTL